MRTTASCEPPQAFPAAKARARPPALRCTSLPVRSPRQPAAHRQPAASPLSSALRQRRRGSSTVASVASASAAAQLASSGAAFEFGAAQLASVLGTVMASGSFLLYTPIVHKLLRSCSAAGMSSSTWAMQLFGFSMSCIYNLTKGFPLAAYGESLIFAVQARLRSISSSEPPQLSPSPQSGAILALVCSLQGRLRTRGFAAGAVAYAVCPLGRRRPSPHSPPPRRPARRRCWLPAFQAASAPQCSPPCSPPRAWWSSAPCCLSSG